MECFFLLLKMLLWGNDSVRGRLCFMSPESPVKFMDLRLCLPPPAVWYSLVLDERRFPPRAVLDEGDRQQPRGLILQAGRQRCQRLGFSVQVRGEKKTKQKRTKKNHVGLLFSNQDVCVSRRRPTTDAPSRWSWKRGCRVPMKGRCWTRTGRAS